MSQLLSQVVAPSPPYFVAATHPKGVARDKATRFESLLLWRLPFSDAPRVRAREDYGMTVRFFSSEKVRWRVLASCRGLDPDLFHPERGQSTEAAKAVCRMCPVRVECLTDALLNGERFGVWGGLSENERRTLRRNRRQREEVTAPEAAASPSLPPEERDHPVTKAVESAGHQWWRVTHGHMPFADCNEVRNG